MNPFEQFKLNVTRRHFFQAGSHVLGTAALASLMGDRVLSAAEEPKLAGLQHFAGKA
jgi:hypothetical protein